MEKKNPIDVAKKLLNEKFPNCEVAFVAGSFNRGEATATSDIDLVIILPHVDCAWRESLIFESWPIEVFIHDKETLNYFFYEVDAKSRIPSLSNMVSESPMIPDTSDSGKRLKELADEVLKTCVPIFSADDCLHARYHLSDLLDDLRAPRSVFEGIITATSLHEALSSFLFRVNGNWSAKNKHIPRQLKKVFPELYKKWEDCFSKALNGDFKSVIDLTEDILRQYGGYVFDGYKQLAPKEWRLKL